MVAQAELIRTSEHPSSKSVHRLDDRDMNRLNQDAADAQELNTRTILVTGGAGYIGSHTCVQLLLEGFRYIPKNTYSESSLLIQVQSNLLMLGSLHFLTIAFTLDSVVVVDNLDNSSEEALNRVRELAGEAGDKLRFFKVSWLHPLNFGFCSDLY